MQLRESFMAKHYENLTDKHLADFLNLDYTPIQSGKGNARSTWFETEFKDSHPFDPA